MISLNDNELDVVCRMAAELDPEKRSSYLERTAAILTTRAGTRHTLGDVIMAAEAALHSLQSKAATGG